MRDALLRFEQPTRDGGAHRSHFLAHHALAGRGGRGGRGNDRGCDRSGARLHADRGGIGLDIFFRHAAVAARAFDLRDIDPQPLGDAPCDRADPRFTLRCSVERRRGCGRRGRRGGRISVIEARVGGLEARDERIDLRLGHRRIGEHRDQSPDGFGRPRLGDDPAQRAGNRRFDGVDDLLGLDIEQRRALGERTTGHRVPLGDRALLHLDAPFGHGDREDLLAHEWLTLARNAAGRGLDKSRRAD